MQVKLLRVLQEREIRRVGENRSRSVNVRVLAATNRDLAQRVADGGFRQDLYYRLKVVELHVPPLRDRRDDILPLARVLLADAAVRMGRKISVLAPRAVDQLLRYEWPGNVRELENATVQPLSEVEKEYILAVLELNGGNQTRTAKQLQIGSATLHRKLKKYGLVGSPGRPNKST
jgi:DNA-binding NtrC family response regulator